LTQSSRRSHKFFCRKTRCRVRGIGGRQDICRGRIRGCGTTGGKVLQVLCCTAKPSSTLSREPLYISSPCPKCCRTFASEPLDVSCCRSKSLLPRRDLPGNLLTKTQRRKTRLLHGPNACTSQTRSFVQVGLIGSDALTGKIKGGQLVRRKPSEHLLWQLNTLSHKAICQFRDARNIFLAARNRHRATTNHSSLLERGINYRSRDVRCFFWSSATATAH
jgi:hypothetical protein